MYVHIYICTIIYTICNPWKLPKIIYPKSSSSEVGSRPPEGAAQAELVTPRDARRDATRCDGCSHWLHVTVTELLHNYGNNNGNQNFYMSNNLDGISYE